MLQIIFKQKVPSKRHEADGTFDIVELSSQVQRYSLNHTIVM